MASQRQARPAASPVPPSASPARQRASAKTEARVLAAGGTRLLQKPFTRRVLLTVVDEVLAGR